MDVFNRQAGLDLAASHSRITLEDEFVRCSAYLADLKARLNMLAPISVLPPETLCEVFLHVAGIGDRGHDGLPTDSSYRWIRITHVCKHWRAAALSCPTLWTKLRVTTQQPWMTEILARSKKAPLDVTAILSEPVSARPSSPLADECSLTMVLEHLARIRSLSITIQKGLTIRVVQLLDGPAPLLESLVLRNQTKTLKLPLRADEHIRAMLHRPENGRLRHLELYFIPLSWKQISLPNLTHLTVSRTLQWFGRSVSVAAQVLIDAIASMNRLEELILGGALDFNSNFIVSQAALPRLKHLRLTGNAKGCKSLLDHIEAPSLSRMAVITVDSVEMEGTELLNAVASKAPSLGAFLCLSLSCLRVYETSSKLTLHAYSRRLEPSTLLDLGSCTPELLLVVNRTNVNVFSNVCDILPIRDVQQLTVSARSLPPSTWLTLFQCTRKVTELAISGCASHETFPYALLHRTRGKRTRGTRPIFHYVLPQLRVLTLAKCSFKRFGDEDLKPYLLAETGLTSRLLDCFTERYEYGAEIEELRLVQAVNIFQEEVDWLKDTVRVVEWDGTLHAEDELTGDTESMVSSETGTVSSDDSSDDSLDDNL